MLTGIVILSTLFVVVFYFLVRHEIFYLKQLGFNEKVDWKNKSLRINHNAQGEYYALKMDALRQTAKESGHNVEALAILQEELEHLRDQLWLIPTKVKVIEEAKERVESIYSAGIETVHERASEIEVGFFDLEWRITAIENRLKSGT